MGVSSSSKAKPTQFPCEHPMVCRAKAWTLPREEDSWHPTNSLRDIRVISHLGHMTHHLGRGCQLCQDANTAATPLEWHLCPQRGSADALTEFHFKALLNSDEKDWDQVQTTCGFQFRFFHPETLYTLKSHSGWVWREQNFSSAFRTYRAAYLSHIYIIFPD